MSPMYFLKKSIYLNANFDMFISTWPERGSDSGVSYEEDGGDRKSSNYTQNMIFFSIKNLLILMFPYIHAF